MYRFLGLLKLLRHYRENQVDSKGNFRKAWVFEFRIYDEPRVVPVASAFEISASLLAESRRVNPVEGPEREIVPLPPGQAGTDVAPLASSEAVRLRLLRFAPYDFEHFVKLVLERSGFVRVSITQATADGGIDANAFVDEDNEFFAGTHVQVQIKRWRHAVGSPEINNFRGALSSAAKGIFVTTSHFTRAALAEARHDAKPSIALIDGEKLAAVIIRTGSMPPA